MTASKQNSIIPILLFIGGVLSRIPFTSSILYNWDSVQFAFGMTNFDLTGHQPHPPGYFLYVMIGKLLNLAAGDANISLVMLSVISSGIFISAMYLLVIELSGSRMAALGASALAATSPMIWHYGEVAAIYVPEAALFAVFCIVCLRTMNSRDATSTLWASAVLLAFIAGFRVTTAAFLFPLWVFSLRKYPVKVIALSLLLFGATSLLWFVAMVKATGGYENYRAAMYDMRNFALKPYWAAGVSSMYVFGNILLRNIYLGVGVSFAMGLAHLVSRPVESLRALKSEKAVFIVLMLLPQALFFIFIFNHPNNPGLNMLVVHPLLVIFSIAAVNISGHMRMHGRFSAGLVVLAFVIASIYNTHFFLKRDSEVSYSFFAGQKMRVTAFTEAVRSNFTPAEAAVFGTMHIYVGPRHFMYYMPEFPVYIYDDSIGLDGNTRNVLSGMNRRTRVARDMEIPAGVKYFVLHSFDKDLVYKLGFSQIDKIKNLRDNNGNVVGFYGDIKYAETLFKPISIRRVPEL